MGLKDLTDEQLREFLSNPDSFLSDMTNYDKVFDLTDSSVRQKVEDYEREMNVPPRSLRIDRPDTAK